MQPVANHKRHPVCSFNEMFALPFWEFVCLAGMVFSCAQHVRGPFCFCLLWHPYFVAAVRVCASLVWCCSHVMMCDGSVLVCVCVCVCVCCAPQSRALVCCDAASLLRWSGARVCISGLL